jgi:uncharacterized iron-regulated membrane protein
MRNLLRKIHLYLRLGPTIFLVVLGVPGSIIALAQDAQLWLNHRILTMSPSSAGTMPLPNRIRHRADDVMGRTIEESYAQAAV